jgi:hypothetical protein
MVYIGSRGSILRRGFGQTSRYYDILATPSPLEHSLTTGKDLFGRRSWTWFEGSKA